jgi:competence ComEA-like helix-hairpin-helix protein
MLKRIVATALAVAFVMSLTTGLAVAAAKPAPAGKVNINTASAEQLTTLPGVGPKLAARILDYRQKSGAFKSVQELMNVKHIEPLKSMHYMSSRVRLRMGNTPPASRVREKGARGTTALNDLARSDGEGHGP